MRQRPLARLGSMASDAPSGPGRVQLRRLATGDLTAPESAAIRAMLDAAFGADEDERFGDDDWQHGLGGVHFVLEVDGRIVAHASVVERELHVGDRPLRTGYVEAVATAPDRQGEGFGSIVMIDATYVHPRDVRARRPRDGPARLLRAARLADVAWAGLRPGPGRAVSDARRGGLHPGPRDTNVAAARPQCTDQLRLAPRRRLVTGCGSAGSTSGLDAAASSGAAAGGPAVSRRSSGSARA